MANLTESPIYEPGIFQLEKTTPPLGGAPAFNGSNPSAGHANAQALQLANRTAWLKGQVGDGSSVLPEPDKLIRADASGKIDMGWLSGKLVSAEDLANATDTGKGAAQVGWDGETVGAQISLSKNLSGYPALRNYSGIATRVNLTNMGISGPFYRDDLDTTSPDWGGVTVIDAVGRRWKRDFAGPILVDWFRTTQSADITAAVKSAAAYINSLSEVPCTPVLEFSPGAFNLTEQVTFNTAVALKGAGAFNTVLTWGADASTAGFVLNHTQARGRPSVQGLDLERTGLYGGTAIKFYRETPDLNVSQKVRVDDVCARNNNGGWECGIEGEKTTGAWINKFEFVGNSDPVDATKYYGTGIRVKGLSTTPSVHWTVDNSVFSYAFKSVDAQNVEGVFVTNFNMVSVDYGVVFTGGSAGTDPATGRPHLHVGPGHISHRRDGVSISNGQQSFVSNVLFYFMTSSTASDAHVRLNNSRTSNIDDNIFTYGSALGKGIAMEGATENCVGVNTHQIQGTSAVSMDATSNNNVVGVQNYSSDWTKAKTIVNNGSGNVMPGGTSRFALPTTVLATGVNTKLTIGGATTNEIGDLRPTADLTRLVIKKSGRYAVSFKAAFTASANGDRAVSVWLNGAQPGYMPEQNNRATAAGFAIISSERSGVYLTAGDYLEVYASQSSGGDISITSSNVQVTYLGS